MKGSEIRGLVSIQLGDEAFSLIYDLNAMCELEEKYGDIDQVFKQDFNLRNVRYLLWLALQQQHSDKFPTEKHVGRLLTLADHSYLMEKLGKVMEISFPIADTEKK